LRSSIPREALSRLDISPWRSLAEPRRFPRFTLSDPFLAFLLSISLCCPSRSAFLRGQCAHNTNITDVKAPYGGWPKFVEYGFQSAWLPTFLEDAGYDVRYTGKLMNGQTVSTGIALERSTLTRPFGAQVENIAALPPKGLVDHAFLLDPFTYDYIHPTFSSPNGTVIKRHGEVSRINRAPTRRCPFERADEGQCSIRRMSSQRLVSSTWTTLPRTQTRPSSSVVSAFADLGDSSLS
jgi:hypothetical protein